jgi:hypothetical protein
MTHPRYRTLLGAALAGLFIGTAIAQTTSDDSSRLSANKSIPQAEQTQPANAPTDKMKGQSDAQMPASDQAGSKASKKASAEPGKEASAAKTSKPVKQASKARSQTMAATEPGEKAFRQALRQCAKEQQQSERDSCLDSAIEQFQRG